MPPSILLAAVVSVLAACAVSLIVLLAVLGLTGFPEPGLGASLALAVLCGAVGLAAYLAALGTFLGSDPRIWRKDSAVMRKLVADAPHLTDTDLDEVHAVMAPRMAFFGGGAFGIGGAMAFAGMGPAWALGFGLLGTLPLPGF